MSEELKPIRCGCGGEAEIFHITPEGCEGSYCVRCTECLTQTPFFNKDKNKAIEVWNTAMSVKDINVLDKATVIIEPFTTDMNHVGYCKCGYLVNAEWEYCPLCGARLEWK